MLPNIFYTKYFINNVASPKKTKKPNVSVAVVKNIPEDKAGSIFNFLNVIGTKNPIEQANVKLNIIEHKAITDKYILP